MPSVPHRPSVLLRRLLQRRFLMPARLPVIRRCRDYPRGRQGGSDDTLQGATRPTPRGTTACCLAALLTLAAPLSGSAKMVSRSQPSLGSNLLPVAAYAAFITEASHRFAIPERWIFAVIRVESGWNANAVSPRGALGLMQIMPQTWLDLSVRYHLGLDPFDPEDNITAGTAYLREMLDRFGSEGIFAAYNAGPARYEQHLAAGRPLPDETLAYIARLSPLISGEQSGRDTLAATHGLAWQQASVFVPWSAGPAASGLSASLDRAISSATAPPRREATALVPRASGLFVRRLDEAKSP